MLWHGRTPVSCSAMTLRKRATLRCTDGWKRHGIRRISPAPFAASAKEKRSCFPGQSTWGKHSPPLLGFPPAENSTSRARVAKCSILMSTTFQMCKLLVLDYLIDLPSDVLYQAHHGTAHIIGVYVDQFLRGLVSGCALYE